MTDLDEMDLFTEPDDSAEHRVVVVEREPRKCRRHEYRPVVRVVTEDPRPFPGPVDMVCRRCGKPKDEAVSRRGKNNRARGNAIEREVAAKLGLRRTGQYGGPDDAAGEWLVVQVKSGGSFPERIWRWLQALPSNAAQTRAVVVTDAPGPGHRRRSLVIVDLEDWAALHGDSPVAVRERLLHPGDPGYPYDEVSR